MKIHPSNLLLSLFVFASSAGGIIYTVVECSDPVNGQRGGAVGVALTFFGLFMLPNYGKRVYDIITNEDNKISEKLAEAQGRTPSKSLDAVADQVNALSQRLDIEEKYKNIQNRYLLFNSVVATLVWGFGDVIAGYFMHCSHH